VSDGESWIIFWDRTSFVLISGRGVLPRSEPDFRDDESAIVDALGVSRAAALVDADEHCLYSCKRVVMIVAADFRRGCCSGVARR
jgi:hypothetical protein